MALDDNFDFQFEVIVIRDSGVGKTFVVQHFASGIYSERQQSTIGVDFTVRSLDIDGKKVKMQVWDTAGQERYRAITRSYYRRAHAAIIVYDITQRSSFESVPYLVEEVKKYGDTNLVIMLMGTKSDLWEKRQVLFEEACAMAEKHGLLAALETSAKESRNINEVFELTAKALIARNSLPALSSVPHSMAIVRGPRSQGSQGASQGSQGARQGSQGARQGSQGASHVSQGARQGSQGARQGFQGASQGSQGARLDFQSMRLDSRV